MKKIIIGLMLFYFQLWYGSLIACEPIESPSKSQLRIYTSDNESNFNMTQEMSADDEEICEAAFQNFYPSQCQSRSFCVRNHFKRLLQELRGSPRRDEANAIVTYLRRSQSEDYKNGSTPRDDPYQHDFPLHTVMRSDIRVQRLLIEAVHEALQEREDLLLQRERDLEEQRARLEKKMSKKYSAILTASISFCTACVSGITVYLSN